MSINQNYSMPYPVLGVSDDYKDSSFSVTPVLYVQDDYLYISQGKVEINNDYLLGLFNEEKIDTAYKLFCGSTMYTKMIIGNITEKIEVSKLSNKIKIEAFLIASEDINDYSDDSFNDDYKDYGSNELHIYKNSIVAVAGSIDIPLDQSFYQGAKSLFNFNATPVNELSFNLDNFHIEVNYPYNKETDGANYMKTIPGLKKNTFLFIFIIPALNYVFDIIKQKNEEGELDSYISDYKPAEILYNLHKGCVNEDTYVSAQKFLKSIMGTKITGESLIKEIPTELIN